MSDKWEPVVVEGMTLPSQPYGLPWDKFLADIRALEMRHDDVMILAYPKAGTHWMWEVIHMLLNSSTVYETKTKEHLMIEFSTKELMDATPSPRILNTHLPFFMLPVANIKDKKVKLVHVYRNPKDSAVSMWYHIKQFMKDIDMETYMRMYTKGPIPFGTQAEYLQQMEQFMNDNPDVHICNLSFEGAKKRPVETVKQLAQFLDVDASDQLCEDIAEACSFKKLKQADQSKSAPTDTKINVKLDIYRKGEVGDWKNHLSAEQVKALDEFIAKDLKGLTKFPMEYTAPQSQE